MPRLIALVTAAAVSLAPLPAAGWGFEAHRFVMDRAIDLLPPDIRPVFEDDRAFVVAHTIDPDLWRTAGFVDENPRHFLNIDAYGAYPFDRLPRDYRRAVEVFGADVVVGNGVLPWRTGEVFGWLREAFEEAGAGAPSLVNIRFYSAVLAHYLADAHVPFHAVRNFDGQLTGQRGIHARWESDLFNRYASRLTVETTPPAAGHDVEALVFDALLSGVGLASRVLDADRAARVGGQAYDDRYFSELFAATRPVLERRLAQSITAIASAIAGAWEQAGRPRLASGASAPGPRPARER